jgi:triosephosphate isomerase
MLVVGNWKMNTRREEAAALVRAVVEAVGDPGSVGVAVCPPAPWLADAADALQGSNVALGAQHMHASDGGAFTGEVAAPMLADLGCRFVILGHSERRQLFGETDRGVGEKVQQALAHRLVPIVCVGETLEEREAGEAEQVVLRQLDAALDGASISSADAIVIAYEPVWAIGTGRTAEPEDAQAIHAVLRARLTERFGAMARDIAILYGGSVKPGNAASLFSQPDLDGGLIGGASLDAASFAAIVAAAR